MYFAISFKFCLCENNCNYLWMRKLTRCANSKGPDWNYGTLPMHDKPAYIAHLHTKTSNWKYHANMRYVHTRHGERRDHHKKTQRRWNFARIAIRFLTRQSSKRNWNWFARWGGGGDSGSGWCAQICIYLYQHISCKKKVVLCNSDNTTTATTSICKWNEI